MVDKEGCNILNISSMNAFTPLTKIPPYSGATAAISNFTQWLAVHFSKAGIRVNAIAPGFFSTKQNAKLLFNEDGTPTPRTGKILAATPMGRFGESEELIGSLLFLLNNDAAGFITGVVLPVDGGFSAYSGVQVESGRKQLSESKPKAKDELSARSFCEIGETEQLRRQNLANRTSLMRTRYDIELQNRKEVIYHGNARIIKKS